MVQYAKGKGIEYARGFVIKYGRGHKLVSQVFDKREDAYSCMNKYKQAYLDRGSKPKVVKWVYVKPFPLTEQEKENLDNWSKALNKTFSEWLL